MAIKFRNLWNASVRSDITSACKVKNMPDSNLRYVNSRTALLLRTEMSILRADKMRSLFQEVIDGNNH